jgi:hypothetical protein
MMAVGMKVDRLTHSAQHRFAQPPTDKLDARRQAIHREPAWDRVGLPLKLKAE